MEEQARSNKNSVFALKELYEKGPAAGLAQSSQTKELGIDIQTAFCPIPSLGLLYPENHKLHNIPEVEFKIMTAQEENILANKSFIRKGIVLDELVKASLIDKSISVDNMLSGDKMSIIFGIRGMGLGDMFTHSIKCPQCEQTSEQEFKISTFEQKEMKIKGVTVSVDEDGLDQVEPFQNLFRFKLPKTGKTVLFKFFTGKDEKDIIELTEIKKKKGLPNEETVTTTMFHHIVSIDDETDRNFISRFARNMPTQDSRALRKHINTFEPGINTEQSFVCPNPDCAFEERITPPLGVNFLWPDN